MEGIQGNGMAWYMKRGVEKASERWFRSWHLSGAVLEMVSVRIMKVRQVVFCLAYSQHRAFYGIYGLAAIRLHRAFHSWAFYTSFIYAIVKWTLIDHELLLSNYVQELEAKKDKIEKHPSHHI